MDIISTSLISVAVMMLGILLAFCNPARWWYVGTISGALFIISAMRLTCEATGTLGGLESCTTWTTFQLGATQLTGLLIFLIPILPEGEFVHVLVCTTVMLMLWVIHLDARVILSWVVVLVLGLAGASSWVYCIIKLYTTTSAPRSEH